MPTFTYGQVYALARSTGLSPDQAVIATAIAAAESGLNPDAVGDTGLMTAVWGPSVGLWQVRTLKSDTGTGRNRDINLVKAPAGNARAMYEISSGGRNWGPWSTWGSGSYRKFLAQAKAAAGGASTAPADVVTSPTYPVRSATAVSVAQGKSPFDLNVNIPLGPLSGPVQGLIEAAGPMLLGGLVVAGGCALVIVGLLKAAR